MLHYIPEALIAVQLSRKTKGTFHRLPTTIELQERAGCYRHNNGTMGKAEHRLHHSMWFNIQNVMDDIAELFLSTSQESESITTRSVTPPDDSTNKRVGDSEQVLSAEFPINLQSIQAASHWKSTRQERNQ